MSDLGHDVGQLHRRIRELEAENAALRADCDKYRARDQARPVKTETFTCPGCDETFTVTGKGVGRKKYCSERCRKRVKRGGLKRPQKPPEPPVELPGHLSLSFNRSFRTHYTDPKQLETQVLAAVRQALRETLGPGGGQESCLVRIER